MPRTKETASESDQRPTKARVSASGYVKNSNKKLSDEELDKLSNAEILAVAKSRGYVTKDSRPFDIMGARSLTRSEFKRAQDEDKNLVEEDEVNERQVEEDMERTGADHTPEGAPAQIRLPAAEPVEKSTLRDDFNSEAKTGHATEEERESTPANEDPTKFTE